MTTEQQYLERAKDARDKAEAAKDEASRRTWLEIAKGFERLAEVPGKTPWHVEKVDQKK